MQQYARFKKQHPECLLLFRMGDFYELFDDDAITAHKALGITLTERTQGIPMAGVPYHALDSYLRRLIDQGFRVAICDQIQDPKDAKGIVDRAVTRVLTPGTLVDELLLDEAAACQLAAIMFTEAGDDSPAVLAITEFSTGQFTLVDLPADRIIDEMARLNPSELLYVETADGAIPPRLASVPETIECSLTARPAWSFRQADATDILREHFNVATLAGFGLDDDDPALGPAGALLRYLQETQAPSDSSQENRLRHIRPPRRLPSNDFLLVDAVSLRSLEIERTMRTGQVTGSLMSILQRCSSPMGKRLLRQWLCFPLRKIESIEARQNAVAALVSDADAASVLVTAIGTVQDVARITGRIAMMRANPRDLVALGKSMCCIDALLDVIAERPAFSDYHRRLSRLKDNLMQLADTIATRCVEHPPPHLREGGVFQDGVDHELDEARRLQHDANSWLAAYQKRLIERTNISTLKVGYNKVFGYYIEITHVHQDKVPADFNRKQTLKNAERYITPELKEFEDKVTTAQARAIEREKVLFDQLCRQAGTHTEQLIQFSDIVAELDVLACFANIALRHRYVRPQIVDEPVLDIRQGRHPVLDQSLDQQFVPNDCRLGPLAAVQDSDENDSADTSPKQSPATLALITGPNMAGKSTYIRQTAIIVLLAHTGCFVPAESATIGLTDRIFTRIGASDELHTGQSTFMVEMTETANILHHATDRSLVILDEIGRGTSTLDGLSLAWAIADTLAQRQCRTLFATHYHEITSLADHLPNVTNLHVTVREWGDTIVFLYRILPGRTDRSYGIHVAQIAGLPADTIQRAAELLETLAVHSDIPTLPTTRPAKSQQDDQLMLFTEYLPHPVVDALREVDLDQLTPIQAFDLLRSLRQQVDESSS